MISSSQYRLRSRSMPKEPEIQIDETPEEQEQRELREFMANLDEEQEIGILQLPTFRRKSTSSDNQKETKEFQIRPPSRELRSPRRHSRRTESAVSTQIIESPEDKEKRELKELLDQLEDEVEVGLLRDPNEFIRNTQPSQEKKQAREKSDTKSDTKSKNTSQAATEERPKETPEEREKREIRELIEQLADEQEIGILDPSTENRITSKKNESGGETQNKDDNGSKHKENSLFTLSKVDEEALNEEDLEKMEIQKLFKELEDEQEEGLLELPGGPRNAKFSVSNSENQSQTETEVNVSVQGSLTIDDKNKTNEEEESLGLDESYESVDYGTLKLPTPRDLEEEEKIKSEILKEKDKKSEISHSEQFISQTDSIGAIFDTNASDLDAEPVWHVFKDPSYGFGDKYAKETTSEQDKATESDNSRSYSRSSRKGRRSRKVVEEKIAQELLASETEKLQIDSEDLTSNDFSYSGLTSNDTTSKDESIAHALSISEHEKEMIGSTSTDKTTSEERIARFLLCSENEKDDTETVSSGQRASNESEETIAKQLLSSEKQKENIGSTSTSKMTFQTSEERIANRLLSSENRKESPDSNNSSELMNSEILEEDEKIARTLLVSENEKEKLGSCSISSTCSMDSIDELDRVETLINNEEKDKLSSTSASSISRQESYERIINDEFGNSPTGNQ